VSLFIAIPAYGSPPVQAISAYFALGANLASKRCVVDIEAHDSNQARARNVLFARFLRSGMSRMLCVDVDVIFTTADVEAMLDVNEDVVSAMYLKKSRGDGHVGAPRDGAAMRGPLLEMDRVGFGMLALSRACVARLSETATRRFILDSGDSVPLVVWTDIAPDGEWLSVDWVFSQRWREQGGQIWTHTGVEVGHVGPHIYRSQS